MLPRVLFDCELSMREEDLARLCQHVELVRPAVDSPYTEAGLMAALQGRQGLFRLGRWVPELTAAVFAGAPDLRLVGVRGDRFGGGIDLEAAAAHGVKVVDADNIASSQPVAEWALALILVCLRNGGAVYRQMMAGAEQWARAPTDGLVSGELTGRRVGLVGCGHVGQRLIELLAPFQVELLVCDPYLAEETAAALGIVRATLDEVLGHAEILVLQTPLTPRTRGLIGRRELGLLRRGAVLINCSRGPVLDQQALIDRLREGTLVAGLDVFDSEPLPKDSLLRTLPNVFISPHIAWYAPNALYRYFACLALEFERFFTGQPLQYELTRRLADIRHGRV